MLISSDLAYFLWQNAVNGTSTPNGLPPNHGQPTISTSTGGLLTPAPTGMSPVTSLNGEHPGFCGKHVSRMAKLRQFYGIYYTSALTHGIYLLGYFYKNNSAIDMASSSLQRALDILTEFEYYCHGPLPR